LFGEGPKRIKYLRHRVKRVQHDAQLGFQAAGEAACLFAESSRFFSNTTRSGQQCAAGRC
jgi:hypothetical protein